MSNDTLGRYPEPDIVGAKDGVVVDGVDGSKRLPDPDALGVNASGEDEVEAEDTGGDWGFFKADRKPVGGGNDM